MRHGPCLDLGDGAARRRRDAEKRQTIELPRDRVIVQCRGKQNRLPTEAELDVVKEVGAFRGAASEPLRARGG